MKAINSARLWVERKGTDRNDSNINVFSVTRMWPDGLSTGLDETWPKILYCHVASTDSPHTNC